MPASDIGNIIDIISVIRMINPKSILEIGVGFGTYGFLIREYLDLKPGSNGGYAPWKIQLDGIEICEKYLTPIHDYIYDDIYIGNALNVMDVLENHYDCLVAIDILEHFYKDKAIEFINKTLNTANEVIICTPYIYYPQGETFNNPYEAHYSAWMFDDFKKLGAKYIWKSRIGLIAVFTSKTYNLPCMKNDIMSKRDINNLILALSMYNKTGQKKEYERLVKIFGSILPNN